MYIVHLIIFLFTYKLYNGYGVNVYITRKLTTTYTKVGLKIKSVCVCVVLYVGNPVHVKYMGLCEGVQHGTNCPRPHQSGNLEHVYQSTKTK